MKNPVVLVVDDERRNIKLLEAFLAKENYNICTALSGESALQLVSEVRPDIILLDVMMPGIDGFEVCRRLKANEKTRAIPVVMVTALKEKEHQVRAMKAGADDFLSKPVDHMELLVRVKSLLRIKAYHDELIYRYQEIAKKNEKLQALQKTKDGLTHMIVHDLRNPLTAISGHLELILMEKEKVSGGNVEKIEKCLNYCRDLDCLIQSLLDIYKMEEGKLELNKVITDPVKLINEEVNQFLWKARSKNIALNVRPKSDACSVFVDQRLIKRVIDNLITNALRHTPAGGEINVDMSLIPENKVFCINVRDNGDGVPSQFRRKIFERFEQVQLKEEEITVGASGLGLTFCKMAVEAHGGKIWVESAGKGKGCTFNFEIPA